MNLALFDFDNTITINDNYTEFLKFSVHPVRYMIGALALGPLIVGYKKGLVTGARVRTSVSRVAYSGQSLDKLNRLGCEYASEVIPQKIRPDALERIEWHKHQGDTVVVVSASLDAYLRPWCKEHGIDLICSELETYFGRCTGGYVEGDCSGKTKSLLIQKRYSLASYQSIFAYGDSDEDKEMLELADKKFFKWNMI